MISSELAILRCSKMSDSHYKQPVVIRRLGKSDKKPSEIHLYDSETCRQCQQSVEKDGDRPMNVDRFFFDISRILNMFIKAEQ